MAKELSERTKAEMAAGRRAQQIFAFIEATEGRRELLDAKFPSVHIYLLLDPPNYDKVCIRVYDREEWKQSLHNAPLIFDHTESREEFPSDFFIAQLMLVT